MTKLFLALQAPSDTRISADRKKRQIMGKFASNTPVLRFDWRKWEHYDLILSNDPAHWDLTRVNNRVCPFLVNHDENRKLGLVESVEVGTDYVFSAKLSRSQEADQYLADVEDDIAGGFSLGCNILETEQVSGATYDSEDRLIEREVRRAIAIEVFEISTCPVPAFADTNIYMADDREKLYFELTKLNKSGDSDLKELEKLQSELSANQEMLSSAIARTKELELENARLNVDNQNLNSSVESLSAEIEQLNGQVNELVANNANILRFQSLLNLANELKLDGKLPLPTFNSLFSISDGESPALGKVGTDKLENIAFFLEQTKLSAPKLNLEFKAPAPELPSLPKVDVTKDAERVVTQLRVI